MNQSYETIISLCKDKGVTYNHVCKELGISPSTIGNLKSHPNRVLNAKYASMLADYFGVSVNHILYGEEQKKPVTKSDGVEIDYSVLSDEQKKAILELLQLDSQFLPVARTTIESLLFSQ